MNPTVFKTILTLPIRPPHIHPFSTHNVVKSLVIITVDYNVHHVLANMLYEKQLRQYSSITGGFR